MGSEYSLDLPGGSSIIGSSPCFTLEPLHVSSQIPFTWLKLLKHCLLVIPIFPRALSLNCTLSG
jgi:hypothetical protein